MLNHTLVEASFPEFEITSPPIGSGGDKVVYRAKDNGSDFALKVMSWDFPDEDDAGEMSPMATTLERFDREISAMRVVSCPHVATVTHGPDTRQIGATKHLWFGEPYLNQGTLHDVRNGGQLHPDAVTNLAKALLTAVAAMWNTEEGLVHRDIKPRNIGYVNGEVVLTDLGAVLFTDMSPLTSPSLAGPGTAEYASPEQFAPRRDTVLDFRSDLFQVGIVLVESLTGSHPFSGRAPDYFTALTSFDASTLDPYPCSDELKTLIGRLLKERPAERFRTPELALRMLEEGF